MSRAFHERPEFRAEQARWYQLLREDGFDDVEGGQLDGYGHLNSEVDSERVFAPQTEAVLEACAEESDDVKSSVMGIHQAARDALYRPEVWRGLPDDARRWWAYQVLGGWTPKRSAEALGVFFRRSKSWERIIHARIGGHHAEG